MHDSGLAAGRAPLPVSATADGRSDRAAAHPPTWSWRHGDTLAVFDVFVVLGLLGVYLKLALLGPQWGAVARFLGKAPGEPLGWLDPLGFFANDLFLNLLVVPAVATVLISIAFGRRRLIAAGIVSALISLAYFIELRASSEVGQYISGDMLRDLSLIHI